MDGKSRPNLHVTGGNADFVTTYKVTRVTGNTVTIQATVTAAFQTLVGAMESNTEDTMDFDRADGMLLKSEGKVHTKITGPRNVDTETEITITKQ